MVDRSREGRDGEEDGGEDGDEVWSGCKVGGMEEKHPIESLNGYDIDNTMLSDVNCMSKLMVFLCVNNLSTPGNSVSMEVSLNTPFSRLMLLLILIRDIDYTLCLSLN